MIKGGRENIRAIALYGIKVKNHDPH